MEKDAPGIAWLRDGRNARQINDTMSIEGVLPKRIFNMQYDDLRHELYLEEFDDEFHFNFKVYGLESQLVNHIMKTYENTRSNLGILFNGVKGTGKTITAKILANKMQLPVILINTAYPGLAEFVSKINSDVILFFDEYEKNFRKDSGDDADILSIMDGVFNSPFRRVFLLTTNNPWVNENMIGRPSRIRYRKSFGNLQTEVIEEYLEDNLVKKEYKKEVLEFIDSLAISTIDILKAVVDELNIHDIPIAQWKNFFNVESAKYSWNCKIHRSDEDDDEGYDVKRFLADIARIGTTEKDEDGKEYVVRYYHVDISDRKINTSTNVEYMQVGEEFGGYGVITQPVDKDGVLITEDDYGETYYIKIQNLENKPSLYRGGLAF